MKKLVLVSIALMMGLSIYSQRNSNNDYWNSWEYTAKKGMTAEFEAAAAKKMQKFNATMETGIFTYKVVTGRRSGTYHRFEALKYPKDYYLDQN